MKETRVPFCAEMILALKDNKPETRRLIRRRRNTGMRQVFGDYYAADRWWVGPHPHGGWWAVDNPAGPDEWLQSVVARDALSKGFPCPYGQLADIILATETWRPVYLTPRPRTETLSVVQYRADGAFNRDDWGGVVLGERWRSPRYMPKEFVRLRMPLTSVRVERLQDITPEDAIAEGVEFTKWYLPPEDTLDPVRAYAYWWSSLHPECPWESNPWVYVLGLGGD